MTDTGAALLAAAGRFADLLGEVPDATALARPTDWTIAETAAHVLAELTDHADIAESGDEPQLGDGPPWAKGRRANREQLERYAGRDLRAIAPQIVPAAERAVAVLSGAGEVWSTNDLRWTGPQTLQLLLGEQLLHGLDVARAAGRPWPISRAEALDVVAGSVLVLPDYLRAVGDPARRLAFELRFRGGPSYRFAVEGDTATIGPAGDRVDCVISADPVAFLRVGYGRANPVAAALTGKLVAFGRKPWLARAFGTLLQAP